MNCEDSQLYLSAYLDDELEVADSLRLQKHLVACPDCRQAQEQQLVLRSALRDPTLYAHPSPAFEKRIEVAVRRAAREEARSCRSTWLAAFRLDPFRWMPAAALLPVMVIGGWLTLKSPRSSDQQLIANAVLAGHIRALQADHLVDVPASDRHTVKPWFQGKLDFSPPVPDLSELRWTLIGGRLDYVDGRPVAALVYQRREHKINVFLWPSQGATDGIKEESAQGYQILHWHGVDMTYWVVSDLNREELTEFARALRGH